MTNLNKSLKLFSPQAPRQATPGPLTRYWSYNRLSARPLSRFFRYFRVGLGEGPSCWRAIAKIESALRIFGADRALLLTEAVAEATLIMLAIGHPFCRGDR